VSHLFRAIDPELRAATAAVLLTGMGKDGAAEMKQLREHGALTIAQDRASSVVYGMPGEAVRLDAAMLVLEPSEIGKLLARLPADPFPSSVLPS
jgi:two-component system chemotaxis response regulator CheB